MLKFRVWDKENKIYFYNVQDAYDMLSGFIKYDDGKDVDYEEVASWNIYTFCS